MKDTIEILVVDDESAVHRFFREAFLNRPEFTFTFVNCINSAKEVISGRCPDVVFSELNLPDGDVMELAECFENLALSSPPFFVVFTSSENAYAETTLLNRGIDDFMEKGLNSRVTIKKIEAILKRLKKVVPAADSIELAPGVSFERNSYCVVVKGQRVNFPRREFDVLNFLVEHRGSFVTREQIRRSIWGASNCVKIRTIDVYIRNIRLKTNKKIIESARDRGYKIDFNDA